MTLGTQRNIVHHVTSRTAWAACPESLDRLQVPLLGPGAEMPAGDHLAHPILDACHTGIQDAQERRNGLSDGAAYLVGQFLFLGHGGSS